MLGYKKILLYLSISHRCFISSSTQKRLELVQLQVIHRHGDRTPITPTKDESFWKETLPSSAVLDRISHGITFIRNEDSSSLNKSSHSAVGKGVFGQLTKLGLMQVVELGSKIRSELYQEDDDRILETKSGEYEIVKKALFSASRPIQPKDIRVHSTNFPRTIQSAEGLLIGLFPERSTTDESIEIDIRGTNTMIPDPQPRRNPYQIELEQILAKRPHVLQKEEEMKALAMKVTNILRRDVLGSGAEDISFGVGEEKDDTQTESLPWSQLAELTTCLRARNKLPPDITVHEQELISAHAAWKWFQNMRHLELSKLAMDVMVHKLVNNMFQYDHDTPSLYIYSAHDSTLIGLLCAFQLHQPIQWPDYASYLKIELLRDVQDEHKCFVRFSLNGVVLKCNFGNNQKDLIPLNRFKGSLLNTNTMDEQKI